MTRTAPARRPHKAIHPDIPVSRALLIQRRQSGIHGHGVYARTAIPAGHVIIEYTGERITKAESLRREATRLERARKGHDTCTYLFHLNQRHDLDGRRGGNVSRFINHSCQPNCHSENRRGHILIVATLGLGLDVTPTGDLFQFLDLNGAGRELRRIEQIAQQFGCGTMGAFGYALVGVLGNQNLPGFEASNIAGTTLGPVLTIQLLAARHQP